MGFDELSPPRFEMSSLWTLPRFLGFLRSWSATARYIEARGEDPVVAQADELEPPWGDPEVPRTISWPLTVRAARL